MDPDRSERPAYDDDPDLGNRRVQTLQVAAFLRKQEGVSVWLESDPPAARAAVTGENVM